MTENSAIEEAIGRFLAAEESLLALEAQAEQLARARVAVEASTAALERSQQTASTEVGRAIESLTSAERRLAESSSALQALIVAMRESAREMLALTGAVRRLDPDSLRARVEDIAREVDVTGKQVSALRGLSQDVVNQTGSLRGSVAEVLVSQQRVEEALVQQGAAIARQGRVQAGTVGLVVLITILSLVAVALALQ